MPAGDPQHEETVYAPIPLFPACRRAGWPDASPPAFAQDKPTVQFIATGGTIAMKIDPVKNAPVPAISGDDLLATVNGQQFRLLAERIARDRRFAQSRIRISGRGRAAMLADPHSPIEKPLKTAICALLREPAP